MNQEKLAKLQAQVRIGGKGTARRKKKVVHRTATADDKKLQSSLKKLAVNNIAGIEEASEHDKVRWHGDPLQQPQGAGLSVRQHVCHHRPRREQTADRDAPGHPQPAGGRQLHQPSQTGRAVPTPSGLTALGMYSRPLGFLYVLFRPFIFPLFPS
ncbi:unnamed protein product [Oncorhynchus mykiss]|uniref:NAC-A/B domain-containing protein n=1 Tax=Oncorhynchus mykiss TaxID=8022 RepID=A0A060YAL9_ONCMY|nr:unnamed protein product [Oncorhynchus mykiss]